MPVNCGSFSETLLESELFGHEKGAFTGADRVHRGLVEASSGGSLFLDEIGETTPAFQVKLLRVLQEQKVRRVGSSTLIPVDVRIITASNCDLRERIREGKFREDLYYRISVVHIEVPPLEQRKEDIPLLVEHFLAQFNARNRRVVRIDAAAIERLKQRQWPGNVRELENLVSRLAILSPTGCISAAQVEPSITASQPVENQGDAEVSERLRSIERQHIIRIMEESGGNRSEAARRLGIERKTLYKKAERLGIKLRDFDKT
jgi:DNA-binding NtrC family response regulator